MSVLRQCGILVRVQFLSVRDFWPWLLAGSVFPLSTLLFFHFLNRAPSPATIERIVGGSLVFNFVMSCLNFMTQEVAGQKENGHFAFYAALPISRTAYVMAIFVRSVAFQLPASALLLLVGGAVFHAQIPLSPWLLPTLLLSGLSTAGFGAALGAVAPNQQAGNVASNVITMVITFLTPVYLQADALPALLRAVSAASPATYAVRALQPLLRLPPAPPGAGPLAAMAAFSLAGVALTVVVLDWRHSR